MNVTFHEDLSYFMAPTSPFLQGKRGSEEKKSCFEEDKEELLQATNQDVPINSLFSTRGKDSKTTSNVYQMTNNVNLSFLSQEEATSPVDWSFLN
ncbi:unnamed protein product [Prunus armeniaca]